MYSSRNPVRAELVSQLALKRVSRLSVRFSWTRLLSGDRKFELALKSAVSILLFARLRCVSFGMCANVVAPRFAMFAPFIHSLWTAWKFAMSAAVSVERSDPSSRKLAL